MLTGDPVLRLPRLLFYLGTLTLAQASIRPGLGLTVSELFFICALGATVLGVLVGRPSARTPQGLLLGVTLFALGGLISSPGAASPGESLSETLHGIYVMLLWVWTGATVLRTRRQIVAALSLWTLSAAFDGFAAITQVAGVTAIAGPLESSRATGLTDHPNDLGAACAVALVPALMLTANRLPWQRAVAGSPLRAGRWLVVGLIAAGLVLSASVAAMLAGLFAITVWLIAPAVRAPGRVGVVVALGCTLIAVTVASGRVTSPTERVQQVTSTTGTANTAGSGGTRIKTIERALPRIEENPVIGTGLDTRGGVVNVISHGQRVPEQVHGAPVAVWYQAGILGLIGLLLVLATLAKAAWDSLGAGDQSDLLIGLSILAAFIAFLVYALSAPFYFQQYGWFAAVMLITWRLRRDSAPDLSHQPSLVPLRAATT